MGEPRKGPRLPPLHAIVDVELAVRAGWTAVDLARAFLDGGARCIQLRTKNRPSGEWLDLCDGCVAAARPYGAMVIVNDRVDLAWMAGAAGVHLGQEDLPPGAARRLLGPDAVIGYSTHTIDQIERASADDVSYVAVGPVFGTRTKDTGYDAVGVPLVREAVRRAAGRPVVAIGGITLDTATQVWAAGAAGVAVISDLLAGASPAARVASYNRLASAVPGLGG